MQETIWRDFVYIVDKCYWAGVVLMCIGAAAGGVGGFFIGKLFA